MVVRIGDHNFTRRGPPTFSVIVDRIIIHPKFPIDGAPIGFDFALLKLNQVVIRSPVAGFACLPEPKLSLRAGHFCNFAGWGDIPNPPHQPLPEQPETLMEVRVPIAKTSDCEKAFPVVDKEAHVCTDNTYGGLCIGDSGGGLHCLVKKKWIFYGLASFTDDNCTGKFSVFVLNGPVLDWIKRTVITNA
nr:unnamed protein product [Spirometra erinaceieuropaei]